MANTRRCQWRGAGGANHQVSCHRPEIPSPIAWERETQVHNLHKALLIESLLTSQGIDYFYTYSCFKTLVCTGRSLSGHMALPRHDSQPMLSTIIPLQSNNHQAVAAIVILIIFPFLVTILVSH